MATSEANICNKALSKIGVRGVRIVDMRADDSEEAGICAELYDDLRDACLAAFPWPFATIRQALARIDPLVEPARDGWTYVYALPAQCLKPIKVWPAGQGTRNIAADDRIPFAIEKSSVDDTRVLLCDLEDPVLFYIAQITDPTALSAEFVDAFAYLLGAEIAPALTGKESVETKARQRYLLKISEAQASALNGQQEDQPPTPEGIAARA